MSNLLKPEPRTIELGGENLALRFELGDIRRAERRLPRELDERGRPIKQDLLKMEWLQNASDLEALHKMLFIALQHSKPDVTLEWIEENVTLESMADIDAVISDVVTDFFGRLRAVREAITQKRLQPIGTDSLVGADSTSD